MDEKNQEPTQPQLPRYLCHKEVGALKIAAVTGRTHTNIADALIHPADEGYDCFGVDEEYLKRHNPQPGGYYIRYEDGYESYSPPAAFEQGYTRIDGEDHATTGDPEIEAICQVFVTIDPLDSEARKRAIDHLICRLGMRPRFAVHPEDC